MCSQSVSGSSLLSGYDEDDARETSGRSRREFEEIDAVLYDEETPKRSSLRKICEEWSGKPHFRVRGRVCHIDRQQTIVLSQQNKQQLHDIGGIESLLNSSLDLSFNNPKVISVNTNELNVLLDDTASGRSSIDSIEGSELTNNSDLDDDDDGLDDADATNTLLGDRFSGGGADSFDTDEDDDEGGDCSSGISTRDRTKQSHHNHHRHTKHPQLLIKCMKDSVVSSLAAALLRQFLGEQQPLLHRYAKLVCAKNAVTLRPKLRPYSLPPRSLSQNRLSLPTGSSITSTSSVLLQQQMMLASLPFRSTPEPDMKLTSLLRVTPLRITNTGPILAASSPRKPQIPALPPPPPPPPPPTERTPTSLSVEKRNQQQQQISLIGTAVSNLPLQLTIVTPQPSSQSSQQQQQQSTTQTRPMPSTWRFRSATTITSNVQNNNNNSEPIPRLPPITVERLTSSDQLILSRSNTITAAIVETVPPTTRAVSGTSTGSNLSSAAKVRNLVNAGKLQRTARPPAISSANITKDLNQSSASTSPARSTMTGAAATMRTTAARAQQQQQQQQKRPLVSTKGPPPAGVIKVPASHIW